MLIGKPEMGLFKTQLLSTHWASPFAAREDRPGGPMCEGAEGPSAQPLRPALLSAALPAGIPPNPALLPAPAFPPSLC